MICNNYSWYRLVIEMAQCKFQNKQAHLTFSTWKCQMQMRVFPPSNLNDKIFVVHFLGTYSIPFIFGVRYIDDGTTMNKY